MVRFPRHPPGPCEHGLRTDTCHSAVTTMREHEFETGSDRRHGGPGAARSHDGLGVGPQSGDHR
jgi:hypothetical protein